MVARLGPVRAYRNRFPDLQAMRDQASAASHRLKALANAQRLRRPCLLVGRERTVSQRNEELPDLSQSALSQHLVRLRAEGTVATRRHSQQIWYCIVDGPAYRLIGTLYDIYRDGPAPPGPRKRTARKQGGRG